MKLYIDDIRTPKTIENDLNIARTFEQVKLAMYTKPNFIDMDFDMGFDEPNGLEILRWFKKQGFDAFIKHINIHSSHPYGKSQMKRYIETNFKNISVTMNN